MSRQTGWLEVDLHSWWSVKGKLGKATQSQPVTQSTQRPEYLSNLEYLGLTWTTTEYLSN